MMALKQFSDWLTATPASQFIAARQWMTPALQSVHLMAIAVAVSSALMINLRLAGVGERVPALASVQRRYGAWLWSAVGVLAATGALLVISEPGRELLNEVFLLKMLLVVLVLALTLLTGGVVRRSERAWEGSTARRLAARSLSVVCLALWLAIMTAGRWIAYVR